jgi:hypothetical protein
MTVENQRLIQEHCVGAVLLTSKNLECKFELANCDTSNGAEIGFN